MKEPCEVVSLEELKKTWQEVEELIVTILAMNCDANMSSDFLLLDISIGNIYFSAICNGKRYRVHGLVVKIGTSGDMIYICGKYGLSIALDFINKEMSIELEGGEVSLLDSSSTYDILDGIYRILFCRAERII